MSTTETYPHRCDDPDDADCRCGATAFGTPKAGQPWGRNCPAALRERVAELERATPGPHITPALLRRVEALGFVPGDANPVTWLVHHAEELAATLANERAAGMEDAAREVDRMASDVGDMVNLLGVGCSEQMRSVVTKVAEAVLKDVALAVRAASEALAARGAK